MVLLWPHTKSMNFLTLVTFLLFLMPAISYSQYLGKNILKHRKIFLKEENITSYAVIFDAGSTGSRVHVYHFDQNLDLLPIGEDLEFYDKVKPGLSSYADDPEQAAESLIPLLEEAESVVPEDMHSKTPLILGATAGLRLLDGNASELILQAVTNMLNNNSTLNVQSVSILDGSEEGSYLWVTINYLLGNLGKDFSETVGVVDLGGGSVQMAYAVSENTAENAPEISDGDDSYIKKISLKGTTYNLYVHSYLSYGKEAARAQILKVTNGSVNPCILAGFNGTYTYSSVEYEAFGPTSSSSFDECREIVLEALNVNESCPYQNCTFGGIWNGGGGSGQKNIFATSSFYYIPADVGIIDSNASNAEILIVDLKTEAERACQIKYEDANSTYPLLDESSLAYVCMDLTYQYALLIDGFGLNPSQNITVADGIEYQDGLVDAAWPLGTAIEAISSLATFKRLMYFI